MRYTPKTDNLNPDYVTEDYIWYDLGFWGFSTSLRRGAFFTYFGCSGVSSLTVRTKWKYKSLLNLTDKGKWLVKW